MIGHAQLTSSRRADWRTPAWLLEIAQQLSGGPIGLDPCAHQAGLVAADVEWFGPPPNPAQEPLPGVPPPPEPSNRTDGLTQSWVGHGLVWVNPPYGGALRAWARKAASEGAAMLGSDQLLVLVPARTETQWTRAMLGADAVALLHRRVRFLGIGGEEAGAPFPSAIWYWGDRTAAFASAFAPHAWVIRRSAGW